MSPEQFVYWLQGFVEIGDDKKISDKEWQVIRDHLKSVFHKVTPERSRDNDNTVITPYLTQPGMSFGIPPQIIC